MKDNSNLTWNLYYSKNFNLELREMKPDEVKIALQLKDDEFCSLLPGDINVLLWEHFSGDGMVEVDFNYE